MRATQAITDHYDGKISGIRLVRDLEHETETLQSRFGTPATEDLDAVRRLLREVESDIAQIGDKVEPKVLAFMYKRKAEYVRRIAARVHYEKVAASG
jgi:hypothetical protein